MTCTLALGGDTMLGRNVGAVLADGADPASLVAPEVAGFLRDADLTLVNLECCISERGERWPAPGKPFFFRAPPVAVEVLLHLGVDAVTLANNHALDHGVVALLDTLAYLDGAGIAVVGAGPDREQARRPIELTAGGLRITLVAVTDHPADFAAGGGRPGVAFADLRAGTPRWLLDTIRQARGDVVLVTPHWGPNMVSEPVPHVRRAADDCLDAGATLIAGHSAHVFHGVRLQAAPARTVLFDLGELLDDYAVDPVRRNDLGLAWRVTLGPDGPVGVDALPLRLTMAHTAPAEGKDRAWIVERLTAACAPFGTSVDDRGDRLVLRAA
jgi:poly-gamma-glutamate capsule biosynthesis protein CapA/YwtB (metallophosphatase superfamily)